MKSLRALPSLLLMLLLGGFQLAQGQGTIVSVTPNTLTSGQNTDVVIRGMGTSFKQGSSMVDLGPYVTINKTTVTNPETIDAQVSVSKTAASSYYLVKVTTGTQTVLLPNGIQIVQLGGKLTASLNVVPVQSLKLSDFDPNNLGSSPLLFTVTVFNDATPRNVKVNLSVSGAKIGQIGTATKRINNMGANAVITIDNRQFDNYSLANTNNPAIQSAIQTGMLPADLYSYKVTVLDDNGNDLADADGTNLIANVLNKPELISPGNPFYSDPTTTKSKQPIFQWFSQGNYYDLYVYEVKPGQKTQEDVANNRPYYSNTGLVSPTYIYPASAPVLEEGKTYAWQVKANYYSSSGTKTLASDLFWFTIATTSATTGTKTLAEVKIDPDQTTVVGGQSFQFHARGYDLNNDTMAITPVWSIIPADAGTIDQNGNFTAGANANTVAVIVGVGDIKDYATVTITAGGSTGDASMDGFLKQLFGLPNK